MKQKLKLLLAYFRGFKTEVVDTYIHFDYGHIEQWDEKFTTKEGKEIQLPKTLLETFDDILRLYTQDFHRYNDYDEEEFWTLLVHIYPKQNRIHFASECSIITENDYQKVFSLNKENTQLSRNILEMVDEIFDKDLQGKSKFEFNFDGSYDEIRVDLDFYYLIDTDDIYIDLTDQLMRTFDGRWWNEGPGSNGTIYVEKGKFIRMEIYMKSKEVELTDMDINVTPDNIK